MRREEVGEVRGDDKKGCDRSMVNEVRGRRANKGSEGSGSRESEGKN